MAALTSVPYPGIGGIVTWPTTTGIVDSITFGNCTTSCAVKYDMGTATTANFAYSGYVTYAPAAKMRVLSDWTWTDSITAIPQSTINKIICRYHNAVDGWIVDGTSGHCTIAVNSYAPPPSPSERLRRAIADRLAPRIHQRKPLPAPQDEREFRARETLRRVLGQEKYRSFLAKGFVSVQAKSGKVYQIFPGHGMTRVYLAGKQLERLCVVLRGDWAATDSLIARYLLILNNEQQFRALANVSGPVITAAQEVKPEERSLVELFAAYKKGLAA